MKQNEKQMAEQLFCQTDISKSQIADCIGINRKTLTTWASDNQWDRIRTSARQMPNLIADNVYIAMANLTNSIVSEDRINKPITDSESKILHRLVLDVSKLKSHATLNENHEMLRYFMEFIQANDPEAVDIVQPLVNDYIKSRAKEQPGQSMPPGFNEYGLKPRQEENQTEIRKAPLRRMTADDFPTPNLSAQEALNSAVPPATRYNEEIPLQEEPEDPADDNYIKDLIAKKQGNLNRAARRKLAKNEARKKEQKMSHHG